MSSNNQDHNSQDHKPIPLSIVTMNKMSNNVYAHTCPSSVYYAPTSNQGVTGEVRPYRTSYDQQLNNKYCYSRQNVIPNRYKS